MQTCELCHSPGGVLIWKSQACRVVRVDDPRIPGFCRVVWNAHVSEMTDLPPASRLEFMEVVFGVEAVLRRLYAPAKINLASLGNQTPHLHWHVIPRWRDDSHFPEPIWGAVLREDKGVRPEASGQLAQAIEHELAGLFRRH